jgi:hypothetical protein
MNRGLYVAFGINTFLTFMAFILLVLVPDLLPGAVGVHVDRSGYFLGYMLGAAEWGLAALTFFGRKLTDPQALRVICLACIVFHVSSVAVIIVTLATGGSDSPVGVAANTTVRLTISGMCAYFGLYRLSSASRTRVR